MLTKHDFHYQVQQEVEALGTREDNQKQKLKLKYKIFLRPSESEKLQKGCELWKKSKVPKTEILSEGRHRKVSVVTRWYARDTTAGGGCEGRWRHEHLAGIAEQLQSAFIINVYI